MNNEIQKKILEELSLIRELLERKGTATPTLSMPTSSQGEWCQACGAWKSYGVSDQHHCTGYKVTC